MPKENGTEESESGLSLMAFFGSRVQLLRTERGWSQGELATRSRTTGAMISYIEHAKRIPSKELAQDLSDAFGERFFVDFYPYVIAFAYPSWFLPFIELEARASMHRVFESQIIPGLLQTEDYARAMLMAVRPDHLEDLVTARMTRQAIFEGDSPPRCWFIMDEQALRRSIGGPDVMAAQLERLLIAGSEPRTVVQVVPDEVAAHPGLAGPFTILSFGKEEASKTKDTQASRPKSKQKTPTPPNDVLYVDAFFQGRTALDMAEVAEGVRAYDLLRSYALSPEASAERITLHLERLRRT